MLIFLVTFVTAVGAAQICLPGVHEAHVGTRTLARSGQKLSHHHDEYYEGDHLHVWFDSVTKKTLVHVYEEDWYNHKGETHHHFGLRDYNRQFHWHGYWNHTTKTVERCQLEEFKRPWALYCLASRANNTGSGTIGKDFKVDFWSEKYEDDDRKFFEDIHLIMERGSQSVVVQERVFGEHFNETEQKLWKWIEHREWFDVSEAPIPSSTFDIPIGCPNVMA